MGLLAIIIYCTVFCLAYAWTLVWILERKEKKYGQGAVSFTDGFVIGSFVVIFVYLSNIVVLIRWGGSAFLYDVALVAALAGFGVYKESRYKLRAAKVAHRRRAEARLLEHHLKKDPANAACYERLSEVYEKLGENGRAAAAARRAVEIAPDTRNAWRLKQLERK